MEREEERERRRLRDRQRRQSMTKEQREQHLARRRRNYQIRRQRAANASLTPLPQSTTGEAATSGHLQRLTATPSTSSDHTLLRHGHETSQILEGSTIQLEGFSRRLRLSIIKRLARNVGSSMSLPPGNNQVAAELVSGSSGEGSTPKPLRLNRVKRLARSLSFPSENTAALNNQHGTGGVY